jgi:hypothetical protein
MSENKEPYITSTTTPDPAAETPLDLEAIEGRLDKITPGEWKFDGTKDRPLFVDKDTSIVWVPWVFEGEAELDMEQVDGEFIANAPTDIAALVAEVKRLREEVNELAFWDWDSPANRTPGPFVPRYPDVKYPVR